MDKKEKTEFTWRGLTSVLTTISFLVLGVTGLVLFITPPGRVAHWTGWSFAGLGKDQWGALHIWFGTIFLAASGFHIYFNWRVLLSYFKSRLTKRFAIRAEWLVAGVLSLIVIAGTLAGIPPFSSLLSLNDTVKNSWEQQDQRAPIPHAELLSLAELAQKADVELPAILANLEKKGIKNATEASILGELAKANGMSPIALFEIAAGNSSAERGHGEAGGAGGGLGLKTVQQVCDEKGLDVAKVLENLTAEGIEAKADTVLRDIAHSSGVRPSELLKHFAATE